MPTHLDVLWCDTTSDLAKLIRRGARGAYDVRLGGIDCRRLGMGDYLLKISLTATKGNAARYAALRAQLMARA